MEHGFDTPPDGPDRRDPPSWSRSDLRLTILLVALGFAALAWGVTNAGALRALTGGGSGEHAVATAPPWCVPSDLPSTATIGRAELGQLYVDLGAVVPRFNERFADGVATPGDMWSDDLPQEEETEPGASGAWPGGYEIRASTRPYTLVDDGLVFTDARVAHAFFELAASGRCHRAAQSYPSAGPPGARNITWTNPDGVEQNDVFLWRGTHVYRVADVRNREVQPLPPAQEAAIVDRLACRLPDAGCPRALRGRRRAL